MARTTTTAPTAPSDRRPTGNVRPVPTRQADAPRTAAAADGLRRRGRRERRVRSAAEAVEHGDRPAQVGQPVDEPPRVVADAVAQRAGDQHRQHQVEAQGAEAHPDRSVGGQERDEGVGEADRYVAVAHRGDHVEADEAHQNSERLRCTLGRGTGPPLGGPADRGHHADHDGGGQEQQGDQSGRPGEVPQGLRRGSGHEEGDGAHRAPVRVAVGGPPGNGQDGAVVYQPSGKARRRRRATPRRRPLMTMAAVEAVLASTHASGGDRHGAPGCCRPAGRWPGR